jgi:GNAT superfamily N-acetyltransferase
MSISHHTDVETRAYEQSDEDAVLQLLDSSLGAGPVGRRVTEFWRWKHLENPFGRSFVTVAEVDGEIVGVRPFMRWRFVAGDRVFTAVRAVDTATHPAHQGKGIFSRLTRAALDAIRPEIDLVFNTPNGKSGPGYLKLGWREVGRVPIGIRVRRPVRFAVLARSLKRTAEPVTGLAIDAESAADALRDGAAVDALLAAAEPLRDRLTTPKDAAYLRWRYVDVPMIDYRAVRLLDGDECTGIVLFRVRRRGALLECVIAELIVRPDESATARRLLRRAARAAAVDMVTSSFPPGTTCRRATVATGHIRAPGGMYLVTNPLRPDLEPDPSSLRSWGLTLGDLEVF